jgi:hypothetical protein
MIFTQLPDIGHRSLGMILGPVREHAQAGWIIDQSEFSRPDGFGNSHKYQEFGKSGDFSSQVCAKAIQFRRSSVKY